MPPKPRQVPIVDNPFDLAQEGRLLAKYESFIHSVAYKVFTRYGHIYRLDLDDFIQEGYLSLIMAIRVVDWSYSTRQIDNYLCGRIKNGMVDFIRGLDDSRSTQWRRYGESIDVNLGLEQSLEDDPFLVCPDYPILDMLELVFMVNRATEGLGDRDRRIVMLAIQGYSNVQISAMVGDDVGPHGSRLVGPSRISQVLSASGLFHYSEKDALGRRKRVKDGVSRSTEYKTRRGNVNGNGGHHE